MDIGRYARPGQAEFCGAAANPPNLPAVSASLTKADRPRVPEPPPVAGAPLPWLPLLLLASATFVALVTELLPAGLLTPMAADLGVSESGAGLLVTAYALAAGVGAVPLIAVTRGVSRHRLLLVALSGFALSNLLTAVVDDYALMLGVRFLGGLVTGLIWSMVGGYAAALVPAAQRGRALAIALGGGSVGFAVGVPASTALGTLVGWRASFVVVAVIGGLVLVFAATSLPKVAGEPEHDREPFFSVLRRPGVLSIAAVTFTVIVGHYSLYTYVDPFVQRAGLENGVSAALLLFGVGSLVGMFASGRFIDRDLRRTVLVALGGISAASLVFGVFGLSPVIAVGTCLLWGLAYGGLAPIMQTASVRAGGVAADVAVSVTVTAWSLAIGLGAVVGGVAFDARGAGILPWVALALTLAGIAGVVVARRGFPQPAAGT